jgi:aspartate dehydrogenase
MVNAATPKTLRVAIAGLGAIGKSIAKTLANEGVPGVVLAAVSAKDRVKAQHFVDTLGTHIPVVAISELEPLADLIIECAPAALLPEIVGPFLKAKKQAVVLSVGGLLFHDDLIAQAKQEGGIIHVPTGALIGLDAMIAAAEGEIHSVRMITRKPPKGLEGAPHLVEITSASRD